MRYVSHFGYVNVSSCVELSTTYFFIFNKVIIFQNTADIVVIPLVSVFIKIFPFYILRITYFMFLNKLPVQLTFIIFHYHISARSNILLFLVFCFSDLHVYF